MWQIVAAVIAASGANKTIKRVERERKQLVVCLSCEAEMDKSARCCKSCGLSELMPKIEFLKHKAEARITRIRYQATQAEQRKRYFNAKKDYESARSSRKCSSCATVYESHYVHCTKCGEKTVRVSEDEAKATIFAKYPEIILSDEDLENLESLGAQPIDENAADPAVALTKKAIKGTAKFAWKGTKAVLREFLK